jgi:hypothetical protein
MYQGLRAEAAEPHGDACYNLREMDEESTRQRGWLQPCVCVWIVAAQVWYYLQFREQFRSAFSVVLHRIWH